MDDISFSEYFEYHNDGFLTWKKTTTNNQVKGGDVAGCAGGYRSAYLRVCFRGKRYYIHDIVWIIHNGPIPKGMQIDHFNHIKTDNRIENLRMVSFKENCRNMPLRKDNTSGFCGVLWHKQRRKWVATIMIDGKKYHLGIFSNIDDAIAARQEAEIKYGFHPNHGKDLNHENQVL